MDEEAKKAQEAEDAKKADEQKKADEAKKAEAKTFTQEELDKQIAARLKREREQTEKTVAETLKKEREEWEKQAKMSAEEREAEERKKILSEADEKMRNATLKENRADARDILSEKQISTDLVDFVLDVDADKTKENIDKLEKAFLKAVEAGVESKLKGKTPEVKQTNTNNEKKSTYDLLFKK